VTDTPRPVHTGEIADLLAWARQLADQGRTANPTERASYQATKTELLGRITGNHITGNHAATQGGEA
jgi:hypothetical protein